MLGPSLTLDIDGNVCAPGVGTEDGDQREPPTEPPAEGRRLIAG
jgi:hypothetical protein